MSNTLPGSVPFGALVLAPRPSRWPRIAMVAFKVSSTIGLWSARSRQRRALAELTQFNAHLLKDIGLTPDQALLETAKWFWQSRCQSNEKFSAKPEK
jgi:uncharacterized protein YjiS (DUF1127 family)